MDRSPLCIYDGAVEAYEDLIENYPASFTWFVFSDEGCVSAVFNTDIPQEAEAMMKAMPDILGVKTKCGSDDHEAIYADFDAGVTVKQVHDLLSECGFTVINPFC